MLCTSLLILIITLVVIRLTYIQSTGLRYLDSTVTPIVTTNTTTTVNLYVIPNCRSDSDCSYNGYCNMNTGKCVCSFGYDTLVNAKNITNPISQFQINNSNSTGNNNNNTIYVTVIFTNNDVTFCNYKLKSQFTAFMLSFFVGFGAEHFFLERNNVGAAKIVFYLVCCGLNVAYFILSKLIKNGQRYVEFIGTFEAVYLSCGFMYMILWNIYDWVNIGYGSFNDGNGFPMLPWNTTAGK